MVTIPVKSNEIEPGIYYCETLWHKNEFQVMYGRSPACQQAFRELSQYCRGQKNLHCIPLKAGDCAVFITKTKDINIPALVMERAIADYEEMLAEEEIRNLGRRISQAQFG